MAAGAGILERGFIVDAAQSLRAKGIVLLLVALAFLLAFAAPVLMQRASTLSEIAALGHIHAVIEALDAMSSISDAPEPNDPAGWGGSLRDARLLERAVEAIDAAPELRDASEQLAAVRTALIAARVNWRGQPSSRDAARLDESIAIAISDLKTRRTGMAEEVKGRSDAAMALTVFLQVLALVTMSALVWMFMTRLVADMRAVTARVQAIGNGCGAAGDAFPIARRDELGQLAHAVALVGAAWARRYREAELRCRRQNHRDMIDTLGAFSQRIVHDIGNPLAGIVGMAQSINEAKLVGRCRNQGGSCHPDVILELAARIARTSRQLVEWSDLQKGAEGPANVNELIERVRSLLAFDRRMSGLQLAVSLDASLPAVDVSEADFVQVLMSFLFDAAERVRRANPTPGWIRIRTSVHEDAVCVEVADNGDLHQPDPGGIVAGSGGGAQGGHTLVSLLMTQMRGRFSIARVEDANCTRILLPSADDSRAGAAR